MTSVCHKRPPLIECSEGNVTKKPRTHSPRRQLPHKVEDSQPESSPLQNVIMGEDISRQVKAIFGSGILKLPCVSARIVACSFQSLGLRNDGPLWKLCDSLVQVEAVSLRSEEISDSIETKKKTSFCGFDLSSSLPPVDRVDGSEHHQRALIDALITVKRAILDMETTIETDYEVLRELVCFLSDHENRWDCHEECAKSIGDGYHTRRVQLAWRRFHAEFETLLLRIETASDSNMFAPGMVHPVLPVERRLAHFIGQAVRWELRHLLNPPPPRGCSQDVDYERRSMLYSQAYAYVEFKGAAQGAAAGDKNLASLVSRALQCLYDYFGEEVLLQGSSDAVLKKIPDEFCSSEASQEDITATGSLLNDRLECILQDIDQATMFLSAVGSCRFLVDLFDIPQVHSEVERRGGWSQLQTYAALSWQYQLYQIINEDAHFVVLANVDAFLNTIRASLNVLLSRETDCQHSLSALSRRKRLKTKSPALLKQYPQIKTMHDRVEHGREVCKIFPCVHPTC